MGNKAWIDTDFFIFIDFDEISEACSLLNYHDVIDCSDGQARSF